MALCWAMVCWTKFLIKFLLKPVKRNMLSTVAFFVLLIIRKQGLVLIFRTAATSASALISLAVLTSSSFFCLLWLLSEARVAAFCFSGLKANSTLAGFRIFKPREMLYQIVFDLVVMLPEWLYLVLSFSSISRWGGGAGGIKCFHCLIFLPGLFLFLALGVNFLLHTSCRKLWRS